MFNIVALSSTRKFELAPNSSGTAADGGSREFWAAESERIGTNWRGLFDLHVAIVNRLQAASSAWGSP
jgi:hypothetical protein